MLWQLHWQHKDGATEMKAQRNISSHEEMKVFIDETVEAFSLPDGGIWLACNERSKDFVLAKLED